MDCSAAARRASRAVRAVATTGGQGQLHAGHRSQLQAAHRPTPPDGGRPVNDALEALHRLVELRKALGRLLVEFVGHLVEAVRLGDDRFVRPSHGIKPTQATWNGLVHALDPSRAVLRGQLNGRTLPW